jgi:hypothetical protein
MYCAAQNAMKRVTCKATVKSYGPTETQIQHICMPSGGVELPASYTTSFNAAKEVPVPIENKVLELVWSLC